MNQHYLNRMFTTESSTFLDQVVDIDEDTAALRDEAVDEQGGGEIEVVEIREGALAVDQGAGSPSRETSSSVMGVVRGETPGSHRVGEHMISLQAQRGKTVRELSRLWKYKDGGSPKD